MEEKRKTLSGMLFVYGETGSGGDHWAFLDERYAKENTTHFVCAKCLLHWDKGQEPDGPTVSGKRYCRPGKHRFRLVPDKTWSYEGLHVLSDGDELTIYAKHDPAQVIWSGTIKFRPYDPLVDGADEHWIRRCQVGISRQQWEELFLNHFPATLSPASEPAK